MKHSALISLLAALVLILSLSFAVQGKDDYETPIIPVVTSTSTTGVTHTTPASTTTRVYTTAATTTAAPAEETTTEPASDGGLLDTLLAVLGIVASFFRTIISLFGGLFA
ncbi:MAG: hypothetical protein IJK64_07320 [Clostridia bacterium]|nr:hypothetical protein [Clostridia bacterium]